MSLTIRKATLDDTHLLQSVVDMASGGVVPALWAKMAPPGMDGPAWGKP